MVTIKRILLGILPVFLIHNSKASDFKLPLQVYMKDESGLKTKNVGLLATVLVRDILEQSNGNVTIVASQNVYNADNTLKEINTLEMVIPNKFKAAKSNTGITKFNHFHEMLRDEENLQENIQKLKHAFTDLSISGVESEASHEEFDKHGKVVTDIYMTKDMFYAVDPDGVGSYVLDKFRPTEEQKKRFSEDLKTKTNKSLLSLLQWDLDGKFISEGSFVNPMMLAQVTAASADATREMMDDALEGLTNSVLHYPDNVADKLVAHMKTKYPDFIWHVIGEGEGTHISWEVNIALTYDNVDLEDDLINYEVYGTKK